MNGIYVKDQFLFALYDLERSNRDNETAADVLNDRIDEINNSIGSLQESVDGLKDVVEKLIKSMEKDT